MSFPFATLPPIRFPGPPPLHTDVVVVGGGIIGIMTAWHLAARGLQVVVCEKGRVAAEQSSRNWGWIRKQGRDPAELPLVIDALEQWPALSAETGDRIGFRRTGVLFLARSEQEMADHAAFMAHARAHRLDTVLLTAAEVADKLGPAGGWVGGMWTASDARAEPWVAVPLIARRAAERGVRIVEGLAVRGLDRAGGKVIGVVTEHGRIRCGAVVVAGGAWSRLLLGAEGVALPQLSVLSSVAATVPLPEVFAGNALDSVFAFRRRADGGYTIAPWASHDFFIGRDAFASLRAYLPVLRQDWRHTGFRAAAPAGFPDAWGTARRWSADGPSPFERCRILNPAPNLRVLGRVQDAFARAFPALGRPALAATWGGMIDTLPDVVPVIDRAPLPGLFIATGMSGHGFGIGPGVGRAMADLVTGATPPHDLGRFRLARFGDGSVLAPGPGL